MDIFPVYLREFQMINRITLGATVAVLAVATPARSQDYNLTIDVTSGPLMGDQYMGMTSIELDNALGNGVESVRILLDLGGAQFTETQDVQDVDARSPRANFNNGEFLGTTYIVSRFGNNPTDIPLINGITVDGFAIDNDKFGYVVGENLYQGTVNYSLIPEEPVSEEPISKLPSKKPVKDPLQDRVEDPVLEPVKDPVLEPVKDPVSKMPPDKFKEPPAQPVPEPSVWLGLLGVSSCCWLTRRRS